MAYKAGERPLSLQERKLSDQLNRSVNSHKQTPDDR